MKQNKTLPERYTRFMGSWMAGWFMGSILGKIAFYILAAWFIYKFVAG